MIYSLKRLLTLSAALFALYIANIIFVLTTGDAAMLAFAVLAPILSAIMGVVIGIVLALPK